ncbi:hypothetical protein KAFR_0E03050 [Kazachstania africana CBS 2517]|uniref:glucan endo-1,3-beta-D-glucosidase n=1 Tax=Kazachstania africana (strain ATCC 22294 / BCRC 22015 / CBS 2517 / CECT 1963 / NBRC 1671 / NRRL Y-8276) TaxID=1071382 RepID=H2AVQ7_KAZAF|nr:hypothetical protein KAFR_0E03050 [Kazachstania africana CBS 2517]CCF58457.1 hypothetical protein KAFR_0E03050 [Kazachstania africana CBS 2517]
MRFSLRSSLSTLSVLATLSKQAKSSSCSYVDGNYYCDETSVVVYNNVGFSSSYNDVTAMDESSCSCSTSSTSFSGTLSPFDEELSVHIRGPIQLKQFGVYYPSASTSYKKREVDEEEPCEETITTRKHAHKRDVAVEYVEVTATVYVNANGETITTSITPQTTTTAAGEQNVASPVEHEASAVSSSYTVVSTVLSGTTTAGASSTSTTTSATSTASTVAGAWERVAYYTPGSATNVTFMNHQGGSGSGVWSTCFGNSLSYASSDGKSCASSSTVLDDVTLTSDYEVVMFSADECSGQNGDCGYYREGIPAFHGFGGKYKIFVFEFLMPSDTDGSNSNQDMPAIWLLNAKIPRTEQYGSCSCWESGCGEMDLFEILSAGSNDLISHIHDGQGSGSEDYFQRPTSSSMKAAVIFNGEDGSIHIVEVSDDFGSTLSEDTVNGWLEQTGSTVSL